MMLKYLRPSLSACFADHVDGVSPMTRVALHIRGPSTLHRHIFSEIFFIYLKVYYEFTNYLLPSL